MWIIEQKNVQNMICMFWIAHLFSKYSSRIYILRITFYGMFDFQLKFKPDIKENILKSRAYDLFFLGVYSQCLYVTSLIASAFFRIKNLLNIGTSLRWIPWSLMNCSLEYTMLGV